MIVDDLYIATVYISPLNSIYTSDTDVFERIESDISKYTMDGSKCIVVIGDFNATTSTLNDFVLPDKADSDKYLYLLIIFMMYPWTELIFTNEKRMSAEIFYLICVSQRACVS